MIIYRCLLIWDISKKCHFSQKRIESHTGSGYFKKEGTKNRKKENFFQNFEYVLSRNFTSQNLCSIPYNQRIEQGFMHKDYAPEVTYDSEKWEPK